MYKYDSLSDELSERIKQDRENNSRPDFAFKSCNAVRRNNTNKHDEETVWRNSFIRDADKIMHSVYYNRYADKTQVFSLYKNDDITRRALHVQYVSRIARTIGETLNLNLDLTEAIALGHDIGHTPFGHAGESLLCDLYRQNTGLYFSHNIQSARFLEYMIPYNITLQTLNGIICHNGEIELSKYSPAPMNTFEEFDNAVSGCYKDIENNKKLIPSTLEGCVVRICDIIAYLGKDRQDAARAHVNLKKPFDATKIGISNSEIINNVIVNIIENSYGKPYIKLDEDCFNALSTAKKQNYELIYLADDTLSKNEDIKFMFEDLYNKLKNDIKTGRTDSPVFTHHIDFIEKNHYAKKRVVRYRDESPDDIVVDYIASMTDDYFIELFNYIFPGSKREIKYNGYFKD